MKEFWNERYSQEDYAYGKEPNQFLRNILDNLPYKGSALFVAEGEGRNSVYAASKGWKVTAFDTSEEAAKKAERLAAELGVEIDYKVGEIEDLALEGPFDMAVLIFTHFPPGRREEIHRQVSELLPSGGYILMEVFSKGHLSYREKNPKAGGPDNAEMLFSTDTIKQDFPGFRFFVLEETETELNEGLYHVGRSRVVRVVGKKI